MSTFSAFLPLDRRAALAEGASLPNRSSGAALFADISGFTPLTAALAEKLGADRGAEALTDRLNQVYGALIAQVHAYRGSVIGFSGDAITCWFDGDDGNRATASALAMQAVIDDLDPTGSSEGAKGSIGIKVAVAAGVARRFLVGDPEISYAEVLAGSVLDRTAAGEKLAVQGDILVSKEVRDSLTNDLGILSEIKTPESPSFFSVGGLDLPAKRDPWPEMSALSKDVAQQWILPPVFQRLELGKGQFVSDLRQATAVFMKFSGIDYDYDEDAGQKLDHFVRWVQSVLERYGGALFQVTLGDKGSYLLLVFGAPIAHEDDTVRALSAALELQQPPAHLNFVSDIQIGVNRGQIFAGVYGGPQRMTYGTLGDAVNVAARLMQQAAPEEILLPARLSRLFEKDFQFQALGQVRMKGLMGPISVTSLTNRRDDGNGQPLSQEISGDEVVGRAAEKAVVEEVLRALADGESNVLLVEGEAGIGKSILVAQLCSEAQALGLQSLEGDGDAIEQTSPYFAWRRIIRSFFEDPEQGAVSIEDRVVSHLETIDPALPRLAPLLNAILPTNFPENELTEAMIGEVRADNLQSLLVSILAAKAAAAPYILVLDDAHWLDSASWALARIVARDVTPLLLVIATRPQDSPSSDFIHLRNAPSSRVVTLDLLSANEILTIIEQRLGVDDLPQPIATLVLDKAEGHPFFGEELAYALRDAGYLRVENGRAELATTAQELERLTFPDTIQGVITSRIDRVTPQQQLTLKVASVIGRIFAYQFLRDIYPIENSDRELHSNLSILEKLEITPLEAPDPELTYIFRHIITQEVTYGLLTFAQRKGLHQAAAEWYEENEAIDLRAAYPLLAYHWLEAEESAKAVPYALKAGKQAMDNGAFREAVKHLLEGLQHNQTVRVITDPVELAEWYYELGVAYRHIGQLEASYSSLSTALDLLERPVPSSQAQLMAGLLGQVSRQASHRLLPRFFDGRANTADHPLLVAKIYEGLQHIFFYRNETIASVYAILRHLNLAEEAPPSTQRAQQRVRSYAAMVNVAGVSSLHKQAQGYIRLTEEALNMEVKPDDRALALEYLAIYFAGVGRWEENETYCRQVAAISETIGNRRRWQETISCLALALYSRGEIERSADLRRQIYAAAEKDEDRQIQVWGLLEFAEIALLQRQSVQARNHIQEAQEFEEDLGLTEQIWLYGLLGVTERRLGNMVEAQTAVDKAQAAISVATPSAFYLMEPISGMIEVNSALWLASPDNKDLEKRARRSVSLLKQFSRSFPYSKPRSLLWEAVFARVDGDPQKARKLLLNGLERAGELQMPYDEAVILLELGAHAAQTAAESVQYLDMARKIFTTLGAAHELERLDALSS